MTNKEAIAILTHNWKYRELIDNSYQYEALDLAIKALEERPQGDLISRTWLKEHKFTTQVCNGLEIEDVDVVAVATIDNAPTVEYPEQVTVECDTEEDKQKLLSALRNARVTGVVEPERPQGEWLIIDDTEQFIAKCSVCGRIEDSRMVKDYPFCHCGADMRGKEE